MHDQLGLEKSPELYVEKMVAGFREVKRVLREDGTLWLNLGDSYNGSGKARGGGGAGPNSAKQCTNGGAYFTNGAPAKVETCKAKDLIGIPWLVAFALRADGWYLRCDIIWHKPNCMPESVTDRPSRCHEYLFLMSKSAKYFYDYEAIKEPCSESFQNDSRWKTGSTDKNEKLGYAEAKAQNPKRVHRMFDKQSGHSRRHAGFNDRWNSKHSIEDNHNGQNHRRLEQGTFSNSKSERPPALTRNKRDVWTVSPACFKEAHFATFPPDLIKPCILAGSKPGDVVIDPFGGSGTTGQVALELGRKAILIELNPDYIELIKSRCDVTPGLALA